MAQTISAQKKTGTAAPLMSFATPLKNGRNLFEQSDPTPIAHQRQDMRLLILQFHQPILSMSALFSKKEECGAIYRIDSKSPGKVLNCSNSQNLLAADREKSRNRAIDQILLPSSLQKTLLPRHFQS